ncbi:Abi-alpha family protein [Amycolatopsis pigmentata]|uniref:Abi-alpha family protein n=1 Tax=Amycolatopsis pigmentata TaxID=450801 RepID=A0ABW5FS83_9PSEU
MAGEDESVLRRAARLVGVVLAGSSALGDPDGAVSAADPLRVAMKDLLDASAEFDHEQAREDLYVTVLRQLTPDEARIVSVLATGVAFPAVDVVGRDRVVLRNASTVGEAAGVVLLEEVPAYLTRLAGLGLVDIDGENAELGAQYEILATSSLVRTALASAKRGKLVRRTARISGFGSRFWAACDPAKSRAL